MAITVPVVGQPVSVETFGKPVVDEVNRISGLVPLGMVGKVYYLDTAGLNNIVFSSTAFIKVWSTTITIAAADIVSGLVGVMFVCTYIPVYANFGFGVRCGWDNASIGVGVGGSTATTAMGPTAFAITPPITVAGNHTMEMWMSGAPNGTYNFGGSAMMMQLAARK